MFNVTRSSRDGKRLLAVTFAFSLVAAIFTGLLVATSSTSTYSAIVTPGFPAYFRIDGGFTTVSIDVSSDVPVTVCITDMGGYRNLADGSDALCYLYVEGETHFHRIWRGGGGRYYLVVISEHRARVRVRIEEGLLVR
ncbi:hypothetical protein [Thermococcus sp.]|uniref:hypothetical protein n=1 Tax=Thermococcus sp. TaxID=35749 RepID=UPI00262CBF98|nr:hypothetical protein [Thermococcus sp.]